MEEGQSQITTLTAMMGATTQDPVFGLLLQAATHIKDAKL
jgi:hypothetical protein